MALSKLGRASPCLHRRHPCSARASRLLANLSFGPIVQQSYTPLAREGSECDSRSVHEVPFPQKWGRHPIGRMLALQAGHGDSSSPDSTISPA